MVRFDNGLINGRYRKTVSVNSILTILKGRHQFLNRMYNILRCAHSIMTLVFTVVRSCGYARSHLRVNI